jgi:hypothetical protein
MATPLCGSTACACAVIGGTGDDGLLVTTIDGTGNAGDQYEITTTIDHDAFNALAQIGPGLTGNVLPENVGSADAPTLRANTSGTWGAGDLNFTGSSIQGSSVYVDTNGQLRGIPDHFHGTTNAHATAWPSTITPTQTAGTATASGTQVTITINNTQLRAMDAIGIVGTRASNVTAVTGSGIQFSLSALLSTGGSANDTGSHVNVTPASNFFDTALQPFVLQVAAGATGTINVTTSITWRSGTWTSLVVTGFVFYDVMLVA